MSSNPHQAQHAHRHSQHGSALLETLLELDSQVHEALLHEALDAVASVAPADAVRSALDVGAGTGAATFELSSRYPEAEVIALDANPAMTRRIAAHAARVGNRRVRTVNRPLLEGGLGKDSVDLAWASSVFHEFADPAREFALLAETIRPGGVLAIMEMDAPPRVLPDEYHSLESRLRHLAHADLARPEWTDQIGAAGFELLAKRTIVGDQELPGDGPGGAYARAELSRLARHAGAGLDARDNATLSQLLGAQSASTALSRVHIRGSRSLWLARRR